MPLLLVDDRDGRVVAELESEDEAVLVLEAMARDDEDFPEYLCLVEGHSTRGSLLNTDTSITIRMLH
jgi:hypothetical protein